MLAVSAEDLKKFDWQDFLDETAEESTLEEMMRQVDSSVIPPEMEEQERKSRAKKLLVTEEAARKMYSYIELNFGRSYMDEREQERIEPQNLPWCSWGLSSLLYRWHYRKLRPGK